MSKLKARVLSCALAFVLLCLPAFSLGVSAADESDLYPDAPNLIDPFHGWVDISHPDYGSLSAVPWSDRGIINFRGDTGTLNTGIYGAIALKTSIVSGHTYYVSFQSDTVNYNPSPLLPESLVVVGIIDGLSLSATEYFSQQWEYSQISDGSLISFTFTAADSISNPAFCFEFLTGQSYFWFRCKNLRFVDVTAYEAAAQTNKIGGFISELGTTLLDGIKSLFVPTDEDIIEFKDTCSELFSDHLGVLYDIGTILDEVVDFLGDILSNTTSRDGYITLPELEFELLGQDIHLWDETTITFDFIDDIPALSLLYGLYKIMLNMIFIFLLFNYAERTFDEVFRV